MDKRVLITILGSVLITSIITSICLISSDFDDDDDDYERQNITLIPNKDSSKEKEDDANELDISLEFKIDADFSGFGGPISTESSKEVEEEAKFEGQFYAGEIRVLSEKERLEHERRVHPLPKTMGEFMAKNIFADRAMDFGNIYPQPSIKEKEIDDEPEVVEKDDAGDELLESFLVDSSDERILNEKLDTLMDQADKKVKKVSEAEKIADKMIESLSEAMKSKEVEDNPDQIDKLMKESDEQLKRAAAAKADSEQLFKILGHIFELVSRNETIPVSLEDSPPERTPEPEDVDVGDSFKMDFSNVPETATDDLMNINDFFSGALVNIFSPPVNGTSLDTDHKEEEDNVFHREPGDEAMKEKSEQSSIPLRRSFTSAHPLREQRVFV